MDQVELQAMKAELRRMQDRIDELEQQEPATPVNRRNMLRGIGAAAAGAAVGGLAFARPAAASAGDIGTALATNSAAPTLIIPGGGGTWADTLSSKFMGALTVSNDPAINNVNAGVSCIAAYADSSKTSGHTVGLWAVSKTGIGAKLDGPVPLKLTDATNSGAPTSGAGTRGQFKVASGDLWFCVSDTPTITWRRITGLGEAGSFHPVTPGRVYDSRSTGGVISVGQNRLISVANQVSPTAISNFVPSGATAIAANVTITGTAGSFGYLCLNPGGDATDGASVINWSSGGLTAANGISLKLNTSRQLTIVCGGAAGGSTHVLVDVFGYYL